MNNLRVVLDLNPALRNRFSGFYAVGAGMLEGFSQLDEKPDMLLLYSKQFKRQAAELLSKPAPWTHPQELLLKKRWLEKIWKVSSFPAVQNFVGDFDIYHTIHHMMPPTKGKPRIVTIHDLRRYRLPNLYKESKLAAFETAVKKADHFIAVSQATKDDLCDIFNIAPEKVDVAHLAVGDQFKSADEQEKSQIKADLSKMLNSRLNRYLLTFSSPDRRKNIGKTIQAFLSASDKIPDEMKLVVVGMPQKNDELYDHLVSEGKLDRVMITGPVEDVSGLLRCAEGLVFASLYEGFGIPILEAFACNVPVITSNCSSMPEIAGDAAIYIDPEQPESISEAIVTICTDRNKRNDLVTAGQKRALDFSWKKTAENIMAVYKKLA
jgi:alpha-1,3-rhamnosyl/mannosyltransferase